MMVRWVIKVVILGIVNFAFSQQALPLIRANNEMVDIKDGDVLRKKVWKISPDLKPDIYITNNKNAKVTFYTDLDSISFTIKPNRNYDFIILLNNRDSAWTRIVYQPTYLEILKQAANYNENDQRPLPAFTYQSPDAPELQTLRQKFNLDSIAGNGNEISKFINLMHWVHNLIKHDGMHENPEKKNALNMIEACQNTDRGLNCRGLAILLNEVYLAMGYQSRFVTCLPKDSLGIDKDCHVINMVYSPTLKKWLWMDPTFDAYVMNEKGELLSIEEVRQRLIEDRPLIVNPDANWNRQQSVDKDFYLKYYMAKNLYMFECPVESRFDLETFAPGKTIKYIKLLPLEYFNQTADSTSKQTESGTKITVYFTNNPKLFWAKPESLLKD